MAMGNFEAVMPASLVSATEAPSPFDDMSKKLEPVLPAVGNPETKALPAANKKLEAELPPLNSECESPASGEEEKRKPVLPTHSKSESPGTEQEEIRKKEVRPTPLDASSGSLAFFDGTIRLYVSYTCPYAQRPWIARNYKGLQNTIELIALDLQDRPSWFKDIHPPNKVPALEHNNQVVGESLDLVKYIDAHFEGPPLLPDDSSKREYAEELLSYSNTYNKNVLGSFASKGKPEDDAGPSLDFVETSLSKYSDGPFFLGQFSMVDIIYITITALAHLVLVDVKKYDITTGRPNLAKWIEELDKMQAYVDTKPVAQDMLDLIKKKFLGK
ncbi:protein IN2-1 homolog B-like isoform X2 [Aristolochia californica]|uniref:protein IN2-1 homolog B-like isoform X2 n=1 Tax=Aristolochia californica TaxID=171875 RepID=UPI0035E1B3C4